MKVSMIINTLIILVLSTSPAFAINKCTSKWSVGYQQSVCPEDAIKSEQYIDKIGAPKRRLEPRYRKRSNDENKQTTSGKKAKEAKSARNMANQPTSPIDSGNEE